MDKTLTKTVTIYGNMNATNKINTVINDVEFIPDIVKIKHIAKYDNDLANSDNILILKSELFDNKAMIGFSATASINLNLDITKKLNVPVRGSYDFWLVKYDNKAPTNLATFDTEISITLEFIKF